MITVKRNKRKNGLAKLAKRVLDLDNQKAQIGYFTDSGQHPTANMNYASLAFLHEFPVQGYHETRPVIGQIKPMKGEGKQKTYFKKLLQDYIAVDSKYSAEDVLTSIGRTYMQKGKYVFGNSALLRVTTNPTPLYDQGFLSDAFGYKTSLNYTLRYS